MGLNVIVGGSEILKRERDAAAMDAGGEGREKARKDQGVGILRYQPLVLYGVPDWNRTSGLSLRSQGRQCFRRFYKVDKMIVMYCF